MGHVISFINMKGGVGKTTLCLSIGEYLARFLGKKILFIDLDPQFNITQSLMNEFDLEEKYLSNFYKNTNIRKIFETQNTISEKPKLPTKDEVIVTLEENIDIIPGTIDLIFEDTDRSGTKTRKINKFILDNRLKEYYNFIFIDCPPTISLYTDSALMASDLYLVPNRIDRYSILGIKLLNQVIEKLAYDNSLNITPLGIIYTMVKEETMKTSDLKKSFEDSSIVQQISLFKSSTSYVNDLSVGYQGNIASKYKKSRDDIEIICNEFLERIDSYERGNQN